MKTFGEPSERGLGAHPVESHHYESNGLTKKQLEEMLNTPPCPTGAGRHGDDEVSRATCGPCNLERTIELLTNVLGELDAIDAQLAELGGLPHMRGPVERAARDFLEAQRPFDILVNPEWGGEDGEEFENLMGHKFRVYRSAPEDLDGSLKVFVASGTYGEVVPTQPSGGDLD